MRVIVAKDIGFCFGVERALEITQQAASEFGTVYTLGELIHNQSVIERLGEQGVITATTIDEIPQGANIIIRSHGVSKACEEECKQRGNVIDATCPFVKRIHEIVHKQHLQQRQIIIVGNPSHAECIGINGNCDDTAIFVNQIEDLSSIKDDMPICLVAQTTASAERFKHISEM